MPEPNSSTNNTPIKEIPVPDRFDVRQNIKNLKSELGRHRRRLFEMAIVELPEDENDQSQEATDAQLIKAMASVVLAEVSLGTDDEPNYTTKLAQVLRLLLRRLSDAGIDRWPSPEARVASETMEKAHKILSEDD